MQETRDIQKRTNCTMQDSALARAMGITLLRPSQRGAGHGWRAQRRTNAITASTEHVRSTDILRTHTTGINGWNW
eukprot:6145251-Lingulodinium_polyedra.AAC.1